MKAREFILERVMAGIRLRFEVGTLKTGSKCIVAINPVNDKQKYVVNDSIVNFQNWKNMNGRQADADIQIVKRRKARTKEHGNLFSVNITTKINPEKENLETETGRDQEQTVF